MKKDSIRSASVTQARENKAKAEDGGICKQKNITNSSVPLGGKSGSGIVDKGMEKQQIASRRVGGRQDDFVFDPSMRLEARGDQEKRGSTSRTRPETISSFPGRVCLWGQQEGADGASQATRGRQDPAAGGTWQGTWAMGLGLGWFVFAPGAAPCGQ